MRGPSRATRLIAWTVYTFMLVPLTVIIVFSFGERSYFEFPPSQLSLKWYLRAWQSEQFLIPAIRSVSVSGFATMAAVLLAVPAAMGLRSLRPGAVSKALEVAFLSPLIVPQLILGIALLHCFTQLSLVDSFLGLLLAHIALTFPFVFRTVIVSVHELAPQLEEASKLLGASGFTTFRLIILPQLVPGILSGSILAAIVSFDQFTVSLLVTEREQMTLPLAIYKYLYDTNDPVVAAVSSVLVAVGLLLTLALQKINGLGRSVPG